MHHRPSFLGVIPARALGRDTMVKSIEHLELRVTIPMPAASGGVGATVTLSFTPARLRHPVLSVLIAPCLRTRLSGNLVRTRLDGFADGVQLWVQVQREAVADLLRVRTKPDRLGVDEAFVHLTLCVRLATGLAKRVGRQTGRIAAPFADASGGLVRWIGQELDALFVHQHGHAEDLGADGGGQARERVELSHVDEVLLGCFGDGLYAQCLPAAVVELEV